MHDPQQAADTAVATPVSEPSEPSELSEPEPAPSAAVPSAGATLLIVAALSLATWWLLIDPRWAVLDVYGNPANAVIFWTLFAIVCLAINLELKGLDRLPQPLRGLAFATATIGAGIGITALLALAWGEVDPSFAPERAGGVGYFTGAVFVLFVFVTNVPFATVFEHRPWKTLGLAQPWSGLSEIAVSTVASLVLYAVFALPVLASWSNVKDAPLSVDARGRHVHRVLPRPRPARPPRTGARPPRHRRQRARLHGPGHRLAPPLRRRRRVLAVGTHSPHTLRTRPTTHPET
ncbi:hypothetical protein ACFWPQ_45065 [Streptomyces sp. NPDC058464]|uniref:hypothetical protein n=1 Tax=Streptomyces sp. NPDC058464 TaxID=3346511 RepID=UPI003649B4DB